MGVPAEGAGLRLGHVRRRLRDRNEADVWQQLHEVLLAELNAALRLDWSRCVIDSATAMTSPSCCRCSTPSHRSAFLGLACCLITFRRVKSSC
ncbi:predicted protein [Streptomyces sp. C]|nr:predicted protein [Streptomyces sp. C]